MFILHRSHVGTHLSPPGRHSVAMAAAGAGGLSQEQSCTCSGGSEEQGGSCRPALPATVEARPSVHGGWRCTMRVCVVGEQQSRDNDVPGFLTLPRGLFLTPTTCSSLHHVPRTHRIDKTPHPGISQAWPGSRDPTWCLACQSHELARAVPPKPSCRRPGLTSPPPRKPASRSPPVSCGSGQAAGTAHGCSAFVVDVSISRCSFSRALI